MEKARLMNQPEDYKKLGLDPKKIHLFEDGMRNSDDIGNNEVWYFDANFDDGSKVVVGFRSKTAPGMREKGFSPNLNLAITRPNGVTTQEFAFAALEDSFIGTEQYDIRFGSDYCRGNFLDYDVHIETTQSVACDLHYHALTVPFRHGTSQIALGDNDEYYYTDLCVPKCQVTGTLTYDNQTINVQGVGYHDHQWMNISPFAAFHHWLWGRMYTDQYVIYIYDFVCSKRFGNTRIPFFTIADNKTGQIIFETNGTMHLQADMEMTKTGVNFPKHSHYQFDNGDNQADFDITWTQILECRDTYGDAPANKEEAIKAAAEAGITDMQKVVGGTKEQYDAAGIHPVYMRFFAEGSIRLSINSTETKSKGTMIYEYNSIGL